eukprot:TRINITY_DN639_c0_g1_i3.p1 TRINITY_DN639_c0_g1~~TRINITY_DN639_c0_g1_i3.p1  ORF type:complete len:288 (-),score=95.08 TRINITY_DN639_c0_g1_i3:74-937(-)
MQRVTNGFNAKNSCSSREYEYLCPTFMLASSTGEGFIGGVYHMPDEQRDFINTLLQKYSGAHNFHNFTIGKKSDDPSAMRMIKSISIGDTMMMDGLEWVSIHIHGQSFMLHQIRRMIGLVIAVSMNLVPQKIFDYIFLQEYHLDIFMVPGAGLMLNKCHFSGYDRKNGQLYGPMEFPSINGACEAYRNASILPEIARLEKKKHLFSDWLFKLKVKVASHYASAMNPERIQKERKDVPDLDVSYADEKDKEINDDDADVVVGDNDDDDDDDGGGGGGGSGEAEGEVEQ